MVVDDSGIRTRWQLLNTEHLEPSLAQARKANPVISIPIVEAS
jgi:hypothetical protein